MYTMQVSIFRVKFLRPVANLISFSHPSQDSIARTDKYKREWDMVISGDNGKAIKYWVEETKLLGTVGVKRLVVGTALGHTIPCFLRRIIGNSSSSSIHQDNQEPRKHNSFSYGKNRSGNLTSNNNSQTRIASSTFLQQDWRNKSRMNWTSNSKFFILSWIKNFKIKHKMYIGNRIAKISNLTGTNQRNYVDTKDNPADHGTRGLRAKEMTEKSLGI